LPGRQVGNAPLIKRYESRLRNHERRPLVCDTREKVVLPQGGQGRSNHGPGARGFAMTR